MVARSPYNSSGVSSAPPPWGDGGRWLLRAWCWRRPRWLVARGGERARVSEVTHSQQERSESEASSRSNRQAGGAGSIMVDSRWAMSLVLRSGEEKQGGGSWMSTCKKWLYQRLLRSGCCYQSQVQTQKIQGGYTCFQGLCPMLLRPKADGVSIPEKSSKRFIRRFLCKVLTNHQLSLCSGSNTYNILEVSLSEVFPHDSSRSGFAHQLILCVGWVEHE